jgi:hypothetical protein
MFIYHLTQINIISWFINHNKTTMNTSSLYRYTINHRLFSHVFLPWRTLSDHVLRISHFGTLIFFYFLTQKMNIIRWIEDMNPAGLRWNRWNPAQKILSIDWGDTTELHLDVSRLMNTLHKLGVFHGWYSMCNCRSYRS